jgi:REP element-mobilizing transposase RayT
MPRSARLDAPGVLHHIIIRGIERRPIFRDNKDRDNLLNRLSILLPRTKTPCYAWALLPNHAHFLLRSGEAGIPYLMRRLLTGYAVYFNRRHDRHGQLFQNRYKSIICQEDAYFKELVRYIHLNPIRGELVQGLSNLNTYRYSGHSTLMGKKKRPWQDDKYVLSYFGNRTSTARKRYLTYVQGGLDQGRRPELTGGGLIRSLGGWEEVKNIRLKGEARLKSDERILGDGAFVNLILDEANEKLGRYYELKSKGYDLERVEQRVSEIFGIDKDTLYSNGRRRLQVEARSLLCYWAVRILGFTNTELARRLGMTQPGIGYAVGRGEEIAENMKLTLEG